MIQTSVFKLTRAECRGQVGRQARVRDAPIHHHYESKGWDEPKIIVRFWLVSALLALVALRHAEAALSPDDRARRSSSWGSRRPGSRSRSSALARGARHGHRRQARRKLPRRSRSSRASPHDRARRHERDVHERRSRRMSPGVPTLPEMIAARAKGIEVIAEIEFAFRHVAPGAKLVAITGTNGKSTTTALTGELFNASGRRRSAAATSATCR